MIRKHKKYSLPRQLFDSVRIKDEGKLVKKYGLKNKTELWKTEAKVKYFRTRAKSLITAEQDEQKVFFDKVNQIGLNVQTISDVLALDKESLLKRRLSSVVFDKKMAPTHKQARQMIVHKRILICGKIMDAPSYLVKVSEENQITLKNKIKKVKEKPVEEKKEEVVTEDKVEETKEEENNGTSE